MESIPIKHTFLHLRTNPTKIESGLHLVVNKTFAPAHLSSKNFFVEFIEHVCLSLAIMIYHNLEKYCQISFSVAVSKNLFWGGTIDETNKFVFQLLVQHIHCELHLQGYLVQAIILP